MDFMNTFSLSNAIFIFFSFLCFFLYVYLGWILPIEAIKEADKQKKSKTFPIMTLTVFGIGPIVYLLYKLWTARGSATSNTTGGTNVPVNKVEPNMPSEAAGAEVPTPNANQRALVPVNAK